jgi:hypothetical protein
LFGTVAYGDAEMPDEQNATDLNEILKKWWQRFQVALAYWHEPPNERFREHYEAFNDLIVILVTASLIEGLLYLAVQFAGFDVTAGEHKTITLRRLIIKALELGVIDEPLAQLLHRVNDMRNGAAHDPDYRLTDEEIGTLYELLPDTEKEVLQPAFRNILPEPTADVIARLTFERIVSMTFDAVGKAHRRFVDARPDKEADPEGGA